jgi:hypothetical protein
MAAPWVWCEVVVGQEHHRSDEDIGGWMGTPVVGHRDQLPDAICNS